jgi:circadian clock protein KaiC
VLPITSLNLKHSVSSERVPTGIARLDAMLGEGGGYYRGSSILVSGTAGTGKSSLAASFVAAACKRGERCLYLAFEESAAQIARNMLSIGIDLQPCIDDGLLQIIPSRSTACGLELHLATIHRAVTKFHPRIVVIDPISNLVAIGSGMEVRAMLTRLVDFLKSQKITAFFTSLNHGGGPLEATDAQISSLADTWISLRDVESSGERNRLLHLLKSRGMAHSNQMREFLLTDAGVELRDVYLGTVGVLTGTARQVQETGEKAAMVVRAQEVQGLRRDLERKREVVEAKIMALRAQSAAEMSEAETMISQAERSEILLGTDRAVRGELRKGDARNGGRA